MRSAFYTLLVFVSGAVFVTAAPTPIPAPGTVGHYALVARAPQGPGDATSGDSSEVSGGGVTNDGDTILNGDSKSYTPFLDTKTLFLTTSRLLYSDTGGEGGETTSGAATGGDDVSGLTGGGTAQSGKTGDALGGAVENNGGDITNAGTSKSPSS